MEGITWTLDQFEFEHKVLQMGEESGSMLYLQVCSNKDLDVFDASKIHFKSKLRSERIMTNDSF